MKNDPNGANEEEKQEILKCEVCAKYFKTRNGLNIHASRMHINSQMKDTDRMSAVDSSISRKEEKCNSCQFIFKDNDAMEKHLMLCGSKVTANDLDVVEMDCSENKSTCFNCDFCDIRIVAASNLEGLQKLKKHHEECVCKPKPYDGPIYFTCSKCEYKDVDELTLKRHIRDKHDEKSVSTSPKPKRRKKKNVDTVESMEVDDCDDALLVRSKMWDDKIVEKRKK